ncbi:v-type atpase 116kda subunit family protein [Stylonychia lemnae]|uniref:V-type proton ATPase subunit a n=1 Tax=Stylonychia lemnae TaxID=5949 RepID=A0A078AEE5_STYLE|nr:v-type atpase 116kda subunit family protein [Stylonychia lemnae]|eukprot:CDW80575.1 v-type atpase 116kda subunit family protein [Stylonychia lemnae]
MGIFRSEDMTLYQIAIPKDDAWDVMNQLGNLNLVHFIDLNRGEQPFNLPYANQIKRCEETERRIMYILNECKHLKVKIQKPKSIKSFLEALSAVKNAKNKASNLLFEEIEHDVRDKEKFVIEQTEKLREMNESFLTMLDYEKVLENVSIVLPQIQGGQVRSSMHGGIVLEEQKSTSINNIEKAPLLDNDNVYIAHIAGTIEVEEKSRLKKLLFRATRGKALTFFQDFEVRTPDGKHKTKTVYIVVFQEGRQLRDRIVRICDSFMGQRFDLPPMGTIDQKIDEVKRNILESKNLTETSKKYLKTYLTQINQISHAEGDQQLHHENISSLEVYKWFVSKEKNLYHALNNMRQGQTTYIGYFWSPSLEEREIRDVLSNYPTTDFQRFENHSITPPTYIKSNEFTYTFQEIVNTYGIPMYKEVNPAVFAIVTFPFLFGVMFGDVGHGGLLLIAGILMCLFNDQIQRTSLADMGQIRHLILLMGIFAFYNGFIYNEFFAIPLELDKSCYSEEISVLSTSVNSTDPLRVRNVPADYGYEKLSHRCVYTFGVDSRWAQSTNMLAYTNKLKMKISVIIAVLQMSMGIIMKGLNSLYFKRSIDFFFEFIPQIIFLIALFGWMDILIIAKWAYPQNVDQDYLVPGSGVPPGTWDLEYEYGGFNATQLSPPVITTMIDIFLGGASNSTSVQGNKDGETFTYDKTKYYYVLESQKGASIALVLIAIAMVPLMLCVKPLVMRHRIKNAHHNHAAHVDVHTESVQYDKGLEDSKAQNKNQVYTQISEILENMGSGKEHHDIGEIFIHQLIETIEFVLGGVSNTASYLRLWALSLAHSQLAAVFLENILTIAYKIDNVGTGGVAFWACFLGFFTFTFGVLMCMDTLECFLHTLRLHWVEFQNKFYKGTGYKFVPFSFETVLREEMKRP